jgi:hypothetical protein
MEIFMFSICEYFHRWSERPSLPLSSTHSLALFPLPLFFLDLFAFIIRMPIMHRLSVFRDDFVFIIYMYQRYTYRVDMSRPVEK